MIIYVQRPSSWAETVYAHYWNLSPAGTATRWPGVPVSGRVGDWHVLELDGVSEGNFVFNDGGNHQTRDLRVDRSAWLLSNGTLTYESPIRPPELRAFPRRELQSTAVDVRLESSNPDDVIYYTLDGSEPDTNSPTYTGVIGLALPDRATTTVVRAFGVNHEGRRGEMYAFPYTIDPTLDLQAPTITAQPEGGAHLEPVDVVFTVLDDRPNAVTAYYTLDGSEPTNTSAVYVRGSAQGGVSGPSIRIASSTLVQFLVVDGAGNETRKSFHYALGRLGDFREETIYFVITTRFYDGDSSKNFFCRDRIQFDAEGRPVDPHWRGNFAGLIQRLDYIRELGFTALWITPPVENRSGLDYHGYHPFDWTRIDPRLESPGATYQDLINAAHARGIKIVQDVVINHSCSYGIRGRVWIDRLPIKYYVPQGSQQGRIDNGPYQGTLGNYAYPFREDDDNPAAPDWYRERQLSDAAGVQPLVDPRTGVTVPSPGYNPGRFFGVDPLTLDRTWYHQHGFIAGGDWESQTPLQQRHLAGDCIDLDTENETVKRYLIDAITRYLDMGVDAIRLDTLKHVERDTVLEYVNAWKARRPGLFVFGENLVKGTGFGDLGGDNAPSPIRPWWYTRLGHDPRNPNSGGDSGLSVLDFSLFSTFRDNLSRGHFGGIGGIFGNDWIYGDATQLVTFLQNHDVGPDNDFRFRFRGDQWMAAVAYNMLWTIRGIPCLYYGEEVEFQKGAPQDIIGNDDTLDSTGRRYFGDYLSDARIEETRRHDLFRHIQRLNLIRRAIPALQKAPMSHVSEWGGGMRFVRDYADGQSYVVVGLASGGDQDIGVSGVRNGVYRDAVTGREITVGNGNIFFHVRAHSAGIYVMNGPGKIGEDGTYLR